MIIASGFFSESLYFFLNAAIRIKYVTKVFILSYTIQKHPGDNMRICDMKDKEVVNICDCKRLGFVADIDFDICNGCILALIIPGPAQFCGFLGRDSEYVIPFDRVRQIGNDIILGEIKVEDCLVKC